MTCKHCLNFYKCLEGSKTDTNLAAVMYNMCFWENSDKRCPDFALNPNGEVKGILHL